MLSQINGSYPTTGVHKELVERYVGAMQMKRALEEGVIDSDDDDEGEDGAEDIEKMMKLMKSTKRAVKDMGKTMAVSVKLSRSASTSSSASRTASPAARAREQTAPSAGARARATPARSAASPFALSSHAGRTMPTQARGGACRTTRRSGFTTTKAA